METRNGVCVDIHRLGRVLVRWPLVCLAHPLPRPQKPDRFAALKNVEQQSQRFSPRAFEPGIFLDDLARFVSREGQQRPMRGQNSEAEPRQAGLFRAEHFALAAQAQMFLPETRRGCR